MINQQIIIRPIITEKAMNSSGSGKYSFIVAKTATKTDIKRVVGSVFKVNVVKVQTNTVKGRKKRAGARRIEVAQGDFKKAMVTLKKGEKIGIFEPGGGEEEKDPKKKKK